MNATYVEKMARFQQTKYTFQLLTEFKPTEPDLEALSQKLVDQCYETYYEEEMITCKLVSSQDSFFLFWLTIIKTSWRRNFQTVPEHQKFRTFFTIIVTSYPLPSTE